MWEIEVTDDFRDWYRDLSTAEQLTVTAGVELLETDGPALGHPHSSKVFGSRHNHMRELRIQHRGNPYRVLYAFDPRRAAILLLGGNKKGLSDRRWYEAHVPHADALYDEHLDALQREGLL